MLKPGAGDDKGVAGFATVDTVSGFGAVSRTGGVLVVRIDLKTVGDENQTFGKPSVGGFTVVTFSSRGVICNTGSIAIGNVVGEAVIQFTVRVGHSLSCITVITPSGLGAVCGAGGITVRHVVGEAVRNYGVFNFADIDSHTELKIDTMGDLYCIGRAGGLFVDGVFSEGVIGHGVWNLAVVIPVLTMVTHRHLPLVTVAGGGGSCLIDGEGVSGGGEFLCSGQCTGAGVFHKACGFTTGIGSVNFLPTVFMGVQKDSFTGFDITEGDKAHLFIGSVNTEVDQHLGSNIDDQTASVSERSDSFQTGRDEPFAGDIQADSGSDGLQRDQFRIPKHGIGIAGNGIETPDVVKIKTDIGGLTAHLFLGAFGDAGGCAAFVDTEGTAVQIIVACENSGRRIRATGDTAKCVFSGDGTDIVAALNHEVFSADETGNATDDVGSGDVTGIIAVDGMPRKITGNAAGIGNGTIDITGIIARFDLSAQIANNTAHVTHTGNGGFISTVVHGNRVRQHVICRGSNVGDSDHTACAKSGSDGFFVGAMTDFQINIIIDQICREQIGVSKDTGGIAVWRCCGDGSGVMTVGDFVIFGNAALIGAIGITDLCHNAGCMGGAGNRCGISTVRDSTAGAHNACCDISADKAGVAAVGDVAESGARNTACGGGTGDITGVAAVGDVAESGARNTACGGGTGDITGVGAGGDVVGRAHDTRCGGTGDITGVGAGGDVVGRAHDTRCGGSVNVTGVGAAGNDTVSTVGYTGCRGGSGDVHITDTVIDAAGYACDTACTTFGSVTVQNTGIGNADIGNYGICACDADQRACCRFISGGAGKFEIIQYQILEFGKSVSVGKETGVDCAAGIADTQTGDGVVLTVEAPDKRYGCVGANGIPTHAVTIKFAARSEIGLGKFDIIHQHEMCPKVVAHAVELLLGCNLIGIGSGASAAGEVIGHISGKLLVILTAKGRIGIVGSRINGPDSGEIKAQIGAFLFHLIVRTLYGNRILAVCGLPVVTKCGVIQVVEVFSHVAAADITNRSIGPR